MRDASHSVPAHLGRDAVQLMFILNECGGTTKKHGEQIIVRIVVPTRHELCLDRV